MKTQSLAALALAMAASLVAAQQQAAPPPAAAAPRSAAELEKLVAPIALYADPLLATVLPASAYPLEIVQAARFAANTNNLAKLDEQPWDVNVKAVARLPDLLKKMNDELAWTIELGEAFLTQEKEVFEAVQRLRARAQEKGTLRSTPQQTVVVTNVVVERVVEQRTTVVTNTVVQIQPANPEVVYVPYYNPSYVYYPPPTYVYDPYAPLVAFGVGVAVGAIIWNDCDWHHGGVYVGHHGAVVWGHGDYHRGDVDVDVDRNVTVDNARRGERPAAGQPSARPAAPQKWQPDQSRLRASSTLGAAGTARTLEARGWGSSGGARASTLPAAGSVAPRPSTGSVAARPTTGSVATRPTASPSVSRPAPSTSSRGSAFDGVSSGSSTRSFSDRGFSSRSGGSYGGSRGISRGGGVIHGGGRGGRR